MQVQTYCIGIGFAVKTVLLAGLAVGLEQSAGVLNDVHIECRKAESRATLPTIGYTAGPSEPILLHSIKCPASIMLPAGTGMRSWTKPKRQTTCESPEQLASQQE